jgi:hypothetical protein
MTEIRPEYGNGTHGKLFDLAHTICFREGGLSMLWKQPTQWEADPKIFSDKLELKDIVLKNFFRNKEGFLLTSFGVELEGEAIHLERDKPCDLDGNPTAEYLLAAAQDIYNAHEHVVCKNVYGPTEILPGQKLIRLKALDGTELTN